MTISLLRAISVVLYTVLLVQKPAMCADISVDKSRGDNEYVNIRITGEIKQGDDLVFAKLANGAKQVFLNLYSEGGDVDAAIGIGLVVRKHNGIVSTGKCYSSCVLIVAGGVMRDGFPGFDDPVIGVHRIFFSKLQPGLTSSQIKTLYDAQLNRIQRYLAKMNVAPELLSFMQSIEPSDMHIMTHKELNRYGLGPTDVIYEERMIAEMAELLGISSIEYRRRVQRGRDECEDSDCTEPIRYGTSIDIYQQRIPQVMKLCLHYTDQTQQHRCFVHFMATGRATP